MENFLKNLANQSVVVFAPSGQVGKALTALLGSKARIFTRQEADFSAPEKIQALLEGLSVKPVAIINAAAYTQVDKAEEEEALAYRVNAESPEVIATWCAKHAVPFIHYSTDYVFPGDGEQPWKEDAKTAPLNAYGRTKLAGEEKIVAQGGKHLIFRTSWVYDEQGKNFLNTMLRLGKEREQLRVVGDQFGAPTYAPHLAEATLAALNHALSLPVFPSGIYHLCGGGVTSWHGFARAIFEQARQKGEAMKIQSLEAIASSDYPTPAKRPFNSRLDCNKAAEILGICLPHWQEALEECMEKHYEKENAA